METKKFEYLKEIGCIYQDILAHELTKIGLFIQCHCSSFFQLQYGESVQGVECKHDSKISKTNNIFFECYTITKSGEYKKGGICIEDNAWLYVIGNGKECWVFSKKQLKNLYNNVKANGEKYRKLGVAVRQHIDKDTQLPTSEGMCVSLEYAERLCLNHLVFEKDYTQLLEGDNQ